MHQCVMLVAKQHEIRQAGFTARGPVLDMMGVDEARALATGETAAFVARLECPPERCRHDTASASHAQRLALLAFDQHGAIRVASDAPHGLYRQT